jgi:hypothetical protein
MPLEQGSKGICTRAEIQHRFLGFLALPLSGTAMNLPFWKVNNHLNPLFFKLLGLAVLNVF